MMKVVYPKKVQDELIRISRTVSNGESLGTKYLDRAARTFNLVYDAELTMAKVQEICQIDEATVYRRVKAFTDNVLHTNDEKKTKEADLSTCP